MSPKLDASACTIAGVLTRHWSLSRHWGLLGLSLLTLAFLSLSSHLQRSLPCHDWLGQSSRFSASRLIFSLILILYLFCGVLCIFAHLLFPSLAYCFIWNIFLTLHFMWHTWRLPPPVTLKLMRVESSLSIAAYPWWNFSLCFLPNCLCSVSPNVSLSLTLRPEFL